MTAKLKILGRFLLLVLAALFIGINAYLSTASLAGNQLPMPMGVGMAVVLSGSMEPELQVGELIFVRQQDDYRSGEVVVYQNGSSLVVHRVVQTDGVTVITRGDANNAPDAPIDVSQIKGAVVGSIPYVGTVARWLRTPLGVVLILGLVLLLLECSYYKERKRDQWEQNLIKEEIRRLQEEMPDQPDE